MYKLTIKLYLLVVFFISTETYAQKLPSSELLINSDNLTFNKLENFAFFEGNVVIHFDDIILKTKVIQIFYKEVSGKNEIDTILVPNKVAILKEKDQTIITANRAKYLSSTDKLTLEGKVTMQCKDNILTTEQLVIVSKLLKMDDVRKKIE
ncbi:MAG: LptA/OstA family protein [Janthinobacterium lividum]